MGTHCCCVDAGIGRSCVSARPNPGAVCWRRRALCPRWGGVRWSYQHQIRPWLAALSFVLWLLMLRPVVRTRGLLFAIGLVLAGLYVAVVGALFFNMPALPHVISLGRASIRDHNGMVAGIGRHSGSGARPRDPIERKPRAPRP